MVYERMAQAVVKRGGKIYLNTPVRKVLVEDAKVKGVELTSGVKESCDRVISTMPVTNLITQLEHVPSEVVNACRNICCRNLCFRNTILLYLEVLNSNPFPDNWIYVHSPELLFGRVTNFRNWVPQLYGASPNTILAMEYWCNPNDEFWQRDDQELSKLAREEIVKSGLVSSTDLLGRSFVVRIPQCYPIYRRGYREHVRTVREYLDTTSGLKVIGRYGSFKYNNQDHSILMGRLAAENILYGTSHNLWNVNTDYESYQEASPVAMTGLGQSARRITSEFECAKSQT